MTYDIHQAAVARGAAYLDSHPVVLAFLDTYPGAPSDWHTLIDIDSLDVESSCDCVIAQLSVYVADREYPDYWSGFKALNLDAYALFFERGSRTWEIEHGFFAGDSASMADSTALTAAWKDYLSAGTQ